MATYDAQEGAWGDSVRVTTNFAEDFEPQWSTEAGVSKLVFYSNFNGEEQLFEVTETSPGVWSTPTSVVTSPHVVSGSSSGADEC